jgi:uncharacterized protein (DUF1778 family)
MAVQKAETKNRRMNLRVAERDDVLFRRAASYAEQSLSEFMLASARERAERLLNDRTRFVLDDPQWAEFNASLDRPAQARPEVVALLRRPAPR